nr:MAG TPA: hypothetical protein [Caudoviricetes sp.]
MDTIISFLSHPLVVALAPVILTWLLDKHSDED